MVVCVVEGKGQQCAMLYSTYLGIGKIMKWFAPQRPYLIDKATIAPDITSSGVLAIVKGLWSRPLNRNLPTM